ncbi:recombinase family protein [Streptomyces yunnanensis]|uniref:Site-specific DNA recombinase n=1 Tax=Streptomyces yunnanensis TaxID=156453 RepID=A0A9X8N7T1_9ACTN|nr:recombinase family protein [Streptomyces yunnanensis]SHN23989.1 Site-specific DNA recombinase [Streptomyces yunnanensis]
MRDLRGMPGIKVRRISKDTEESAALDSQDKTINKHVGETGIDIIDDVEDATVSGSVNLADRPSLGKWMSEPRLSMWQVLVVTEQDRITRDDWEWMAFLLLCRKHGKHIRLVSDPEFDLYDRNSRLMSHFRSYQDSGYLEAVSTKRKNQKAYFRDEGLWSGGVWPFGYRPIKVKHNGKIRWKLVKDEITAPLVMEAYLRVVEEGDAITEICADWNERGIRTPRDHQRFMNGVLEKEGVSIEPKGARWEYANMYAWMTSVSSMGQAMHDGEVVLAENGLPRQYADPILTPEQWQKLQEVIVVRGESMRGYNRDRGPWNGALWCLCGQRLQQDTATRKKKDGSTKRYEYFRCATRNKNRFGRKCAYMQAWHRAIVLEELEDAFMAKLGGLDIMNKRYEAGRDNRPRIAEIKEAIGKLTARQMKYDEGDPRYEAIEEMMDEHVTTLRELEKEPVVPARWIEESTGETFGQKWASSSPEERGKLLRRSGVRFIVAGTPVDPTYVFVHSDDFIDRAQSAASGLVDPVSETKWLKQIKEFQAQLAA